MFDKHAVAEIKKDSASLPPNEAIGEEWNALQTNPDVELTLGDYTGEPTKRAWNDQVRFCHRMRSAMVVSAYPS